MLFNRSGKSPLEVKSSISEDQRIISVYYESEIKFTDITNKLYRILNQLAPFGPKNSSPIFISKNVVDSGYTKRIGKGKDHLRINIKHINRFISGIGFGMGRFFKKIQEHPSFDICYSIEENEWNGKKSLQLRIKDIKI